MNFHSLDIQNILKNKVKRIVFCGFGGGCFMSLIILAVIIWQFIGPIVGVVNFVSETAEGIGAFFDKLSTWISFGEFTERSNAWYAIINSKYDEYSSKGIYIDRALITSALLYDQPMDPDMSYEVEITEEELNKYDDIEDLNSALENSDNRSHFEYTILAVEAKQLSDMMVKDGVVLTEEEYREELKKNYAEYKLKSLGYKIPSTEEGKDKLFEEFLNFIYLKKEVYEDLYGAAPAISVCGGADIPIEEFKTMTTSDYVKRMAPLAQADYMATGILPSVTLAQSMIESGWGKSGLAQKGKNFFGIKASSTVFSNGGWDGKSTIVMKTQEHVNGHYITVDATWRKYNTVSDSIKDHSALLTNGRYKKAGVPQKTTAKEQITAIHKAGYATSPTYVSTIMKQISSYDLTKYDTKQNGSSNDSLCETNGDYVTWKQTSKVGYAPWENTHLGKSSSTIRQAGCLVTSISIQIARSGTKTILSDFNPGTFVEWQNNHNGFTGANFNWNIGAVAPNFKKVKDIRNLSSTKASSSVVANQISDLINQHYYVVIHVKGKSTSNHWVAVDKVQNNQVYIFDPAGANGVVTTKYHTIDRLVAFSAS